VKPMAVAVNFRKAVFVKSVADPKDFLSDHPVVTFLGRSNAGKSTLINGVVENRSFMKSSKTPGLTRLINYGLIDGTFYVADVPGYGYASFERESFAPLMTAFLSENPALRKVYLVIDSRRLLMEADDAFATYLEGLNLPLSYVFTKIDKLSASERQDLMLQEAHLAPALCFETRSDKKDSYEALRKDILRSIRA
jgi:GTP-binding protein